MKKRTIALVLALVMLVGLTGCGTMSRTTPQRFLLNPGEPPSFAGLRGSGTAAVGFVGMGLPFAGEGFVYKVSPSEWEVDPYNQFLVGTPQMMTSIVRQWIADSGFYGSVASPGDGGGQEWVVEARVTELYGDFVNPFAPLAVIGMEVQLVRNVGGKRTVAFIGTYSQQTPVAGRSPEELVAAWDEGLRQILLEVSRDLAQRGR